MALAFLLPYMAKGEGQVVFFLIVLIWIIAGLLKKASEASKRSGSQPPRGPARPGGGASPKPKRPSLSDFLRRIQEMSGEAEEPRAPREVEPERPTAATVVRTPPLPRRPTVQERPGARPSAVRMPSLKRPERREKPREAEKLAEFELELEKAPEFKVSAPEFAVPTLAEPPRHDAYAIRGPEEHRITQILGGAVSPSAFKKGIILSEILGPPRALRPRRGRGHRR